MQDQRASVFAGIGFVKPDVPFRSTFAENDHAPQFRASFEVPAAVPTATLSICTLGFGYAWINGRPVSDHLHDMPPSDYTRTLWYRDFDVTHLLRPGRNVMAVWCGNGYYNESLQTPWDFDSASWRDLPKFICRLRPADPASGGDLLTTNALWRCRPDSAVTFNQLRSGEHFDARLHDPDWTSPVYDDSAWPLALADPDPPTGLFRPATSPPIRVHTAYPASSATRTGPGRWLFDCGQNLSGFIRLHVHEPAGTRLTIRYAEEVHPDNSLKLNDMPGFYPRSDFQTDRYTADGHDRHWSPLFTYHGFRYVEISGFTATPLPDAVTALFTHADTPPRTGFDSSDPTLNRLFHMARMATLSNFWHMPTDCPTREKLGWVNDAQTSAEAFLLHYDCDALLRRWMVDIADAQRPAGDLPGIVPTGGWGYGWGTGPVSEGVLFEIPWQFWLQHGDDSLLIEYLPRFERYLSYLETRRGPDGLPVPPEPDNWLPDWATPDDERSTPPELLHGVLWLRFLEIAAFAHRRAGSDGSRHMAAAAALRRLLGERYLGPDGRSLVDNQAVPALFLTHGIGSDPVPLRAQLVVNLEAAGCHSWCGMATIRHLFDALHEAGRDDLIYRILTVRGFPSYHDWIERDATTLHELWPDAGSKNHHMYSCFTAWYLRGLLGIQYDCEGRGWQRVTLAPAYISALSHVKGHVDTAGGRISVHWRRAADGHITLDIRAPESIELVLPDCGREDITIHLTREARN